MKIKFLLTFLIISFALFTAFGQKSDDSLDVKYPRVVITDNTPKLISTPPKASLVTSVPVEVKPTPTIRANTLHSRPRLVRLKPRILRYSEIKNKIEKAKRQMRIKPLRIFLNDPKQTTMVVRIAFYDRKTKHLDYAVIPKSEFLSKIHDSVVRTESGQIVRVRTIRGNGVNTPVMVFDLYNRTQIPLLVQYPIEKNGRFREMAYYVSTHPGIVTKETVTVGQLYVRNIINVSRQELRKKGIFIQPKIADIAERLAVVEHVDHTRFKTEYHPRIYDDIYMLYALNKGQTYRYSVSRAGAGGMVQMIPTTYRMIRSKYYRKGLIPDFIGGMRNHENAVQAMLLYMQMTWNDLVSNNIVYDALEKGIATQEELMAAGYNSNPARLPRYIRRGGANWRNLIPRETRIYLRIYDSVKQHVPLVSRKK